MEQLIFFGVIIFFSILESMARKRKAKQRGELPLPEEMAGEQKTSRPTRVVRRADPVPTYDSDPSYDDARATSSESMIPDDLWEEIQKLASAGKTSTQPVEASRQSPRPPKPASTRSVPVPPKKSVAYPAKAVAAPEPAHRVHLAHKGFGTDPSERAPSEQDRLDPLATKLGRDPAAARRQIRGHGAHALRQAVILQEILAAPVALRDVPNGREWT